MGEVLASASSQVRPARIVNLGFIGTDLGELGIVELPTGVRLRRSFNTLGINESGVVVGGVDMGNGAIHAFVWIPGPGPAAWVDLHEEVFGSEDELSSFANAINDEGIVVGQYGADLLNASEAWAWLTTPTFEGVSLHSIADPLSVAYDVSDGSTAAIVGEMLLLCDDQVSVYARPFRIDGFDGTSPAPSMVELPVTPPKLFAFASSIVPSGTAIDAFGGEEGDGEEGDECEGSLDPTSCPLPASDAALWPAAAPSTDLLLDPLSLDPKFGALALAVNASRDVVGMGWREDTEPSPSCSEIALLWPNAAPNETPFELGSIMPGGEQGDSSRAEGVGERDGDGCVRVVGWNTSEPSALLWYGNPEEAAFCAHNLNDLVVPCNEELREYFVYQAFEVSSSGHVAVVLLKLGEPSTTFHAGMLTCSADLDGDLRVDAADLGLVLGEWCGSGTAPPCSDAALAAADLNCDGVVDGADTGIVFVQWSDETLCVVAAPCACYHSLNSAAPDPLEGIEGALVLLGFASLQAFGEWALSASQSQLQAIGDTIKALICCPE